MDLLTAKTPGQMGGYDIKIFDDLIKQYHPDICKDPNANDITANIIKQRDVVYNGWTTEDDAGLVTTLPKVCKIEQKGQIDLLLRSLSMYRTVKEVAKKRDFSTLLKYLPDDIVSNPQGNTCVYQSPLIPMSIDLGLDNDHVNWVMSRLIEFTMLIHALDFVHGGLTPGSLWISPENHGVIVCNFYHMGYLNGEVITISGLYKNMYPETVFLNKKRSMLLDTYMIQQLGLLWYKNPIDPIKEFLKYSFDDSGTMFKTWRALLKKNFPDKFLPLVL